MTTEPALICRFSCGCELSPVFDFGTAPVSSFLPENNASSAPRCRFRLASCPRCEVIQLCDLPPLDWLQPPDKAVLFRDPERHLDDLCAAVAAHVNNRDGLVLGLTYKDVPTLERLQRLGFTRTLLLDRERDWELTDPRQGIETIQSRLTPERANRWREQYGPVSLLVVRHLLEHAHQPRDFLEACRTLVGETGCVLFEVPGCETEFTRGDAGALWEEHVAYFTSRSLPRMLQQFGFATRLVGNYPYAVEDCLAAFGRFDGRSTISFPSVTDTALLHEFHAAVEATRQTWSPRARGRRTAMLGAGHRTATFVDLFGLGSELDCIADDDPAKQGRRLPGSGLSIVPTAALQQRGVELCIAAVNPDVLDRIAQRETAFAARGGTWVTLSEWLTQGNGP